MEKRTETFAWEFTIPLTVTVLSHSKIDYADARKLLRTIPKEDILKILTNALDGHKDRVEYLMWYGGEHPEEGIYLRELTYDEKCGEKQTEEIPIPLWLDGEK